MDKAPLQLDYAPRVPSWRTRARWSLLAAMGLLLALIAPPPAVEMHERLSFLRLQRANLNFEHPRDAVLFRMTPADTAQTYPDMQQLSGRQWTPRDWERYCLPTNPGFGFQSHGTIFLHRRRSPAGHERLVALDLNITWNREWTLLRGELRLIQPGTFLDPHPREIPISNRKDSGYVLPHPGALHNLCFVPYGTDFRLLAGRADPNDQSRFSFEYIEGGQRTRITGHLRDDDSVVFTTENGQPLRATIPTSQPGG